MARPALEVADIFRAHGSAWRQTQQGHLSLGQLKVMSAIEQCRSAALGGHVLLCDPASKCRSPTIPAATGIVEIAKVRYRAVVAERKGSK